MTSNELFQLLEASPQGQQLLFDDPDYWLVKTPFKDSGNFVVNQEILIHWWMNVYKPGSYPSIEQDIYRTWSNAMWQCFHRVSIHGYNPHTGQTALTLTLIKNEPESALQELELWLPHIKPWEYQELGSVKTIHIMDRDCSEHGSITLVIGDSKVYVTMMRYHRFSIIKTFGVLADAIKYLSEKNWYETKDKQED